MAAVEPIEKRYRSLLDLAGHLGTPLEHPLQARMGREVVLILNQLGLRLELALDLHHLAAMAAVMPMAGDRAPF
ncbi:MAG TPA: hypothetical protein VND20_12255 [Candidatus Binataceae bacterium]|nr:hypothetical protein [Candidatus Binataceae bacterium]